MDRRYKSLVDILALINTCYHLGPLVQFVCQHWVILSSSTQETRYNITGKYFVCSTGLLWPLVQLNECAESCIRVPRVCRRLVIDTRSNSWDHRDPRVQKVAAAISRCPSQRFVCLHFDHHGFVRQAHRARRVAAFRSLWLPLPIFTTAHIAHRLFQSCVNKQV